ncbi:MAG: iron chaperone [Phenylobacterium sp.]
MKAQASSPPPASVDGYIERCKPEVQAVLRDIRAVIRRAAPEATERLSYNMPTFFMGRVLIHYGAFNNHIGLFPPVRDPGLQDKVAPYRGEKGNLRFPLDQPIPYDLIAEIVTARVKAASAR